MGVFHVQFLNVHVVQMVPNCATHHKFAKEIPKRNFNFCKMKVFCHINIMILYSTSLLLDEIHIMQKEDSNAIQVNEVEQTAYKPEINELGEWVVSMHDVDCLAIGAGILGCGGGGSPYLGWLGLKQYLKQGKQPRIMHIDRYYHHC